jgi:hypothetical protein
MEEVMGCLGVLFAIDKNQEKLLLKCKNDKDLVNYIQENIEKEWDENWLCETDKSWDAIHRCFANGKLELFGGKNPLNAVIFGSIILNKGSDYYVSFKNKKVVKKIGKEINTISKDQLRVLYDNITSDYQGEKNDEDFEYTWDWFNIIKEFYLKISKTDRSVIFTVDQ